MNYAFFGRSNVISLSFIFYELQLLLSHFDLYFIEIVWYIIAKEALNNQYTYTKTWTVNYE